MPCIGGAISKDIKHSIIPFLDELDETSASIQSVNTVIVGENGRLKGYNTDVVGFRAAIMSGMQQSPHDVRSAVCYGYGGVTSVVTSTLRSLGVRVFMAGRNLETAAARAKELSVEVWSPGVEVQLFVNATPATEAPLHLAENLLAALQGCVLAFDHEMPGRYLQQHCAESGVQHIEGLKMYHPQMEAQWALFLHGLADPAAVPELLKRASL